MIQVRDGKGGKDRLTILPESLVRPLQEYLKYVRSIFDRDRALGFGSVPLPHAMDRKYPNIHQEWGWQYVCVFKFWSGDKHALRMKKISCHILSIDLLCMALSSF